MQEYNKICPICGSEFVTNNINRRYCSTACQKKVKAASEKRRRERVASERVLPPDRECAWCGKPFKPKYDRHLYCSESCCEKRRYHQGKDHLENICVICGQPFKAKTAKQKTCSKDCWDKIRCASIKKAIQQRCHQHAEAESKLSLATSPSFNDEIYDTSVFDNHYKWASHGDYIHYADFNLGF